MKMCRAYIAVIAAALTVGCMYIPTFEHGLVSGRAMIGDSDIAALVPGETRREDVLLRFGEPGERLQDDEFFCYRWERVQGWFGVGAGYGGAVADVGKVHYFCAQFSTENIYVRGERIDALLFGNAARQRDAILKAWDESGAHRQSAGSTP